MEKQIPIGVTNMYISFDKREFKYYFFFFILQVLSNDIGAHQASVDSVTEAGKQVIVSEGGAQANQTRDKLDKLNNQWENVLTKARDKQLELEDALREVLNFMFLLYLIAET